MPRSCCAHGTQGPLERLVDRCVAHNQAHMQRAAEAATGARPGGGVGPGGADPHAVALAHVSALAGLCLAIGLKYAGGWPAGCSGARGGVAPCKARQCLSPGPIKSYLTVCP